MNRRRVVIGAGLCAFAVALLSIAATDGATPIPEDLTRDLERYAMNSGRPAGPMGPLVRQENYLTNENYPACLAKEMLYQLQASIEEKDLHASAFLLQHGCVLLKDAVLVTELEDQGGGLVTFQVIVPKGFARVWSVKGALRRQ